MSLSESVRRIGVEPARIKAANDDISQRVINHDVEHHVRVRFMEAWKPGCNEGSRRDPQRVDAKRAAHLSRGLTGFGDCDSHLSKQRGNAPVEELATGRWRDASSRAIQ